MKLTWLVLGFAFFSVACQAGDHDFVGKFFCEDSGSGHQNWDYEITVEKRKKDGQNPDARVEMNGFQVAENFKATAVFEKSRADIFIKPEGFPGITVFSISLNKGKYRLNFKGVQSNTGVNSIECKKEAVPKAK